MTFIINIFVICLAKLIREIFFSRPWLIEYLASAFTNHVPHEYNGEMRKKTDTVSMDGSVKWQTLIMSK